MSDMHKCRRIYLSGANTVEWRSDHPGSVVTVKGWLEYNRLTRPGCTLLVDGKVDTLGICFQESDRQRLETQYASDAQAAPCQGVGG